MKGKFPLPCANKKIKRTKAHKNERYEKDGTETC